MGHMIGAFGNEYSEESVFVSGRTRLEGMSESCPEAEEEHPLSSIDLPWNWTTFKKGFDENLTL